MNGVLYKYTINIWQTKYFQEIQKIKFEEKNDVSRVTRKSAILTIKKNGNSKKVPYLSPKCRKTK